jgi:hypothetical protein
LIEHDLFGKPLHIFPDDASVQPAVDVLAPSGRKRRLREKAKSARQFNLIWVVQSSQEKFSAFASGQISITNPPSSGPQRGAFRDRHERRAGRRWTQMRRRRTARLANGEVVWFWRPDAGVKFMDYP